MKQYRVFGCTEKGWVRRSNEDHLLIGRYIKNQGGMELCFSETDDYLCRYGILMAVADGIGGIRGGGLASKLALSALEKQFYGAEKESSYSLNYLDALKSSAIRANETLIQHAQSVAGFENMGCTLAGVCLIPEGYFVFNAGDSRVYRYRNGILKLLTQDDTVYNLAVRTGQIRPGDSSPPESHHTLTNCMGLPSFQLQVDNGPALIEGDILLICSDGLYNMVELGEMETLLKSFREIEQVGHELISQALKQGGGDNISLILVSYEPSSVDYIHPQEGKQEHPLSSDARIINPDEH